MLPPYRRPGRHIPDGAERQNIRVATRRQSACPSWVILDRDEASSNSRDVACAPNSGNKIRLLHAACGT
jgi:hypothetical protein